MFNGRRPLVKWSALAVMHVYGSDLDPEALRRRFRLRGATTWKKGARPLVGTPYVDSGLKLTLVDAKSPALLERGIRRGLLKHRTLLRSVMISGGAALIDVGLFVPEHIPRSLHLGSEFLRILSRARIALEVSAYPCSAE